MATSCEHTNSNGTRINCNKLPSDREYTFQKDNHETRDLSDQKNLPNGTIEENTAHIDRTTDSEFFYYNTTKTTGEEGYKYTALTAKIVINRLTGEYLRYDHTWPVLDDGSDFWNAFKSIGYCIPTDSVKENRKF